MASVAPATRDDAWLTRAVERYHELCAETDLAGPAVAAEFVQAQRAAGLTFGDTVQCRSLRPAFITRERLDTLRRAVAELWVAFQALEKRALRDATLAADLGLSSAERALAAIDPGYDDATVVSRLDTYFADRPRVLEYNADSPAGMSYQAGQAALMRKLPVMSRFAAEYRIEDLRADAALRETLLDVWREFAARKGLSGRPVPTIAIVDLEQAATSAEFRLVAGDLEAHGVPAVIATPEDLSFRDGELSAHGRRIDLVYKRLLVADFLARYDVRHPLIQAYAGGAVCVASSFRCTISHKKMSLAVLGDQHSGSFLSGAQRESAVELLALTRPYDHSQRPILEAHQAAWVLKPNDAHGGENVVLGWESDSAQWRGALDAAERGGYVVQERVAPTIGQYPVLDADDPQRWPMVRALIEDCNAYVFRGGLGGVLTRLSEEPVINVARGGQAIPTFVLSPL